MDTGLRGKIAIVTGGAQGIGKGICLRFAQEGIKTVIADINVSGGQHVIQQIRDTGGEGAFIQCDVTASSQLANLVKTTLESFGAIDILANCAGIALVKPFRELTEAEWDRVVDVNLKGTYLCCSSVLPHMVERRSGKIINIASIAALYPTAQQEPYCAAKAGVIALTRSLAYEYAGFNINVNVICPGIVRTPIWEKALDDLSARTGEDKETIFGRYVDRIPLRRAQTPDDIANAVIFLSSDLSRSVTAASVSVTGGMDSIFFS
jgi:meso-butanediol dehydrogenase / (S,S)-butanediol dehydrogenase / diacetyl reductase